MKWLDKLFRRVKNMANEIAAPGPEAINIDGVWVDGAPKVIAHPPERQAQVDEETRCWSMIMQNNTCPICDTKGELLEGPRGGMNVNIKCGHCQSVFNVCEGIPFYQLITDGTKVTSAS